MTKGLVEERQRKDKQTSRTITAEKELQLDQYGDLTEVITDGFLEHMVDPDVISIWNDRQIPRTTRQRTRVECQTDFSELDTERKSQNNEKKGILDTH